MTMKDKSIKKTKYHPYSMSTAISLYTIGVGLHSFSERAAKVAFTFAVGATAVGGWNLLCEGRLSRPLRPIMSFFEKYVFSGMDHEIPTACTPKR